MINYLKGFSNGFSGFNLIFLPGIRAFVIIPLLINISLFSAAIYLLSQRLDAWIQSLLPSWLSWLEWLIWPLFATTALLFVFYSFTLIANLIAAPFNSVLAARVEAHLSGEPIEHIQTEKLWQLVLRSVTSELHKLLYFCLWLIPLIILSLIPGLNLIAPLAWFVFSAWSLSLEYIDYPLSNHGLLFKQVRGYNRQHRMRVLGFGSSVFIITSIPILNFLAMPVAVAGATKLTIQNKESSFEN